MICFQGPLICYALVIPEALLVTQTRYFSQFFPRFFVVYAECVYKQMHLILNSDICSLLVRIDRVALKREWKLYFLEWELRNTIFCSQFINFPNIFWGARPQTPLEEGDYGPLFDTVGYSIQTCWLLQLLLKPLPSLDLFILFKQMNCLLNRNKSPQNMSISVSPFGLKWKISLPSTS